MEHLMIDLETLGTSTNAVIVQISAVFFDPFTKNVGKSFAMNVSEKSSLELGLTVDKKTVNWWNNQSDEAKRLVFTETHDLKIVLRSFWDFVCENVEYTPYECKIWANSPAFDCVILKNAINKSGFEHIQLSYANERDVRTLISLFPTIQHKHVFIGEKHNGVADCLNQITIVQKCFEEIYKNK